MVAQLLGAIAGATLVWLNWHPGSKNPAMPTDRVTLILIAATGVWLAYRPLARTPRPTTYPKPDTAQ